MFLIFLLLVFSLSLVAKEKKVAPSKKEEIETKTEGNVIYKYKKHQDFDFENLDVQGDPGAALGDITISSRSQKDFINKLPYRKNFDPEIKKALERVR